MTIFITLAIIFILIAVLATLIYYQWVIKPINEDQRARFHNAKHFTDQREFLN